MKTIALLWSLSAALALAQSSVPPFASAPFPPRPGFTQEALTRYSELTGRTLLQASALPQLTAPLTHQLPADTNAAAAFLEAELAKQDIALVPDGAKFVRVLPAGWRTTPLAAALEAIKVPSAEARQSATNHLSCPAIDLNTYLDFFSEFHQRTILRPAALPACVIHFSTRQPLTHDEVVHAFRTVLLLNGIASADDGDKFVQVVPAGDASQLKLRAPAPEPGAPVLQPAKLPALPNPAPHRETLPDRMNRLYIQWIGKQPPWTPRPTDRLVELYAGLLGKKVKASPQFAPTIVLAIQTPLTKAEMLYAIETTLALNNLAIVPVGDDSVRLGHISETRKVK